MEVKQEVREEPSKIEMYNNEVCDALPGTFKTEVKKELKHQFYTDDIFNYLDLKEYPIKTEINDEAQVIPLEERKQLRRSQLKFKMKNSLVWDFFKKNNKTKAECSICKKILKYYGSTTNLKKHLTKIHPFQLKEAVEGPDDQTLPLQLDFINQRSCSRATEDVPHNVADQPKPQTQPPAKGIKELRLFGGPCTTELSDDVKFKIDNSVLKMIVLDYQPFSFVENRGFRELVNNLNPLYKIPGRKYLTNTLLSNKYSEVRSSRTIQRNKICFFDNRPMDI
ncbi:E3 SUMO-protein ligase ZBED1-like isoform X3 [Diabrotica undecimpunctata]|uniref:E3 SUMO-protein ligase ZBED1-like isoform X3 n=1 Tax=Diabrotica undecimpunctata TaxID=50387 RepID=UPI003B63A5EE